jgi:hypothetical protein
VTARPPHPFQADPDLPPDHRGRPFCRCGVVRVDGDPRHEMPAVPEQAEHRRRVGEEG